ncbi:MAG TPA: hypothetical protein VES02_05215 [Dermatophilaceae bacterium]|nr:hypothetical protein [Dermatophilaceae bacterium]
MNGVLTVDELRTSGMTRPFVDLLPRIDGLIGLRQTAKLDDLRLTRIHAALVAAPSGAILSGWAAAVLHGIPSEFLDGTSDGTKPLPVEFIVPPDGGAYERDGLRLRWAPCGVEELVRYHGRPVTSGTRTAADLTRWAMYPEKALAAIDMSLRHGLTTRGELTQIQIPRMKGYRGIQLVRDALAIASDRAESPSESELRYFWLESGLPSPSVNSEVYDPRGRLMGRIDLLDDESGYGAEYNGHWHQMWDRPEKDRRRLARLRSLNLTVNEFTRLDLGGPGIGQVNSRLRDGYALAVGRDGRHDAFRISTPFLGLPGNSAHRP